MSSEWRFLADFHTHTRYSDGKGSIMDNAFAAKEAGLSMVGITDHGPNSIGLGVKKHDWDRIRAEVQEATKTTGVAVLFGCEANVISLDGTLDVPHRLRKSMDIVLAGLHPIIYPKSLDDGLRLSLNNMTLAKVSASMARRARMDNTKAIVEAVYKNDIDIVSHPGLKLDIDTEELARACSDRGTALEISAGHDHMTPEFVRLAKRQKVKFAIGSDAHSPEDVGELSRGEQVARRGGLGADSILNAVEVQEASIPKSRIWREDLPLLFRRRQQRG